VLGRLWMGRRGLLANLTRCRKVWLIPVTDSASRAVLLALGWGAGILFYLRWPGGCRWAFSRPTKQG